MRTLVIGDIHGAFRALKQVMEEVKPSPDDTLIFLGDYVDGWSESAEVIEYLLELSQKHYCIFVRGNHDTWCEQWLTDNLVYYKHWLTYGGDATVKSYEKVADKAVHIAFFNQLTDFHIDAQNRLFIHAGYTALEGPQYEANRENLTFDRTLWELAMKTDANVAKDFRLQPKKLKVFNEIFIGHTPTLNWKLDIPMHAVNVWNVDTGTAYTGRLTVMDAETKQFWQSSPVRTLYPQEKGRNKN